MTNDNDTKNLDLLGDAESHSVNTEPSSQQQDAIELLQQQAETYALKVASKAIKLGYEPKSLFCYTDAAGQPMYFKVRHEHPDFESLSADEQQRIAKLAAANNHKWIRALSLNHESQQWQLKEPDFKTVYPAGNGKKPLYRLLDIVQAEPSQAVYLFEGEQKADYAASIGLIGTTCGGSNSISSTHLEPLAGRNITIWADNDTAGIKARDELAAALQVINCSVSYIDVPALELPEKGDIIDWVDLRGQDGLDTMKPDIEALSLVHCEPPQCQVLSGSNSDVTVLELANDDQAIEQQIEHLAQLSSLVYEQCRKDAATKLAIRASVLDKLVSNARKELEASSATDNLFDDIQPHHSPVDGGELLEQIKVVIDRHIVCEPSTSLSTALWIMFTWCIDVVHIAPIACITAPEKRCGKTQLLTLIGELCYKPMPASNITAAALFRSIEKWMPTLLLDEADSFMKESEDLRGVINAGHSRKSAYVIRTTGDTHEPTRFHVFCAKAISGIGHLPETIKDRSIILELRRKQPHETRQRLRHADPLEFNIIRSKLCRWSMDNMQAISQARPELPDCLNDRAQDNWEALLAIADLLGGDWSKKARHAAITISGDEQQGLSINEELLVDIKSIFDRIGQPRIFTEDLIEHLCSDEDLAWQTWNRGRPITPRQLANRLGDYKIKPKSMRIGSVQLKGYELLDFNDAFIRYLPKTPISSVPPSQTNNTNGYNGISSVPDTDVGTDEKTLKSLQDKACHGGTDKNNKLANTSTKVML